MIVVKDLVKEFAIAKKKPGVWGAIQYLWQRDVEIKQAVASFNLTIEPGEIVGLLGPNGAGKTTLMKMFTGIIVPDRGHLEVLGHRPAERKKEFRQRIALVMGQKSQLWWDIPAMDSLILLQKYYEISESVFKKRLGELSEIFDIGQLYHVHVRKLSLGERMKMELVASLLHDPSVIFLDEPTIGLDVVAQENIRKFLLEYHKVHHTTLILTSHYMADVMALCKRIVLILAGEKRFDGAIGDFEKVLGKEKFVTFYFAESLREEGGFWKGLDAEWNDDRTKVELRLPQKDLRSVTSQILTQFPVIDFGTEKMPIERVMSGLIKNPELLSLGLKGSVSHE
jgi:ABC-2 type transport system ATP-binding protein